MATWMGLETAKRRLSHVDPLARTALAAACGERVFQVYDKRWVGSYFTAVKEAVDFGWSYASPPAPAGGGDDIGAVRIRLLAALKDVVAYLNEEGVTILASSATVSLRIVESATSDAEASILAVARALGSTLYVAQMAGQYSGGDVGKLAAEKEELAWLEGAVSLVESWRGPCQRGMFDAVGPTPPRWWVAYDAGQVHY